MNKELRIKAEELADEVAWLNKLPAVSPESAVIQVTALLGAVMLRRTNFEQYRESVIPIVGGSQASILVDTAKLLTAARSMAGTIVLTIGDSELVLTSRDTTARINSADKVVDFPKWPEFESTSDRVTVGKQDVARALTSIGTDDTLPQLMMVALDDGAMVTTDRFRLTKVSYADRGLTGKVPGAVLRAFSGDDGVLYAETGRWEGEASEWIELRSDRRIVTAPMVDDNVQFPEWQRLVPENPPVQVAFDRQAMLKAITGEQVTLTVGTGSITVTSKSKDVETVRSVKLYTTVSNTLAEPLTVTMRSRYVKDALRGLAGGVMLLHAIEPTKPVAFVDLTEKDLHLVMPIREPEPERKPEREPEKV